MIKVENLTKKFGNQTVLDRVSFTVPSKSLYLLTGKSGCGKTTLLKILGLVDQPTSGKVFLDGVDVGVLSDVEKAEIRNKKIGFVFQDFHLDNRLTVYENVEIPLLIAGVRKSERKKAVAAALEQVNFTDRDKSVTEVLSGGEKQRVAIARAVVNGADIILADEPCGSLDADNARKVYELLAALKSDKTVILSTHTPEKAVGADGEIRPGGAI